MSGGGRLKGKRALVAGAGAIGPGWGNGKAAAVLFAREGALVAAADIRADAAAETAAIIRGEGGTSEPIQADFTNPDAAASAVDQTAALWGGLDILHFNVGFNRRGGLEDAALEDWRAVFDVTLTSAFLTARAAAPAMRASGGGAMVFVSSIAAHRSGAYAYISYEVAKAAVERLARSIAREYAASGIRANVVAPGLIDTPHVAAFVADGADPAEVAAARAAMAPMKRQGTAWDVAYAALYLASDEAAYVTGATLPVDGGLLL